MISYQIVEHGKPLQRVLSETPKPRGSEVLVRVTRSGVCHSDLHILEGFYELGAGKRFYIKDRGCVPPFTPGHEPLGIVEALGPRAEGVKVGQKRIVCPWIGCGKCAMCKDGFDNYCAAMRTIGVIRPGAYSTHLLVPHPKYLVDATGIDDSFAATLACSGVTAYSAVRKLPRLSSRDAVAVIGCGGVGLATIGVLRATGVRHVIACDVDEAKLATAKRLGAALVLDTRAPDAVQKLQSLAKGSLGGVIDLVGMPATAALGVAALRRGGRYVICGLYGGEITHPLPNFPLRAIGIVGSYVGNVQELKEVVALARKKKLKPLPLETRSAERANASLEDLKNGKVVGRIVLNFETVE
jgi:D-arabinose 1-dehydrogenase-like Zn-dependent alcohol dehydrogenase